MGYFRGKLPEGRRTALRRGGAVWGRAANKYTSRSKYLKRPCRGQAFTRKIGEGLSKRKPWGM